MDEMSPPDTQLSPAAPVRRFPLRPHHLVHELTPASDVFVLAPLGVPKVDVATWRLSVTGMVERPRVFSFDDILKFPKRELRAFHQCAGDPRRPTLPTRRIANVVWGGIELAAVLDLVGVMPDASFLWAAGLDHGVYADTPVESYLKDAPLQDALKDGFLAYELNGAPLGAEYGYPLRLVLPGFYGTNSVKWLHRLELADARAQGVFTTTFYNDAVAPTDEEPLGKSRPVWRIAPESVIVSPAPKERLSGSVHEIWGWAWAYRGVEKVEVSVDGGQSWQLAELGLAVQRSWQKFRLRWRPEGSGTALLISRATDRAGEAQPPDGARNAYHAVAVETAAVTQS
jgi:DMSO/TMAO reductase YedYZ molybdopterin-dependent catalytic subunit